MANIEHELRVLDIDVAKVTDRIMALGGKKNGSYLFRRYVFDAIPAREGEWIRLRTDGTNHTLTFKSIKNDEVDGTSEWEVAVDNFDTTHDILTRAGLVPKAYQENRRTEYVLGTSILAVDEWPRIQPYLEIEDASVEKVKSTLKKLGYEETDCTGENVQKIYSHAGIDLDNVAELRF